MTILPFLLLLAALPAHQERFLRLLLPLWLALPGRVNALNLSRYSQLDEKTFRRWFNKALPWHSLYIQLLRILMGCGAIGSKFILTIDATFIPKSGQETYGLGQFWSSCDGRAMKGLECSCIALMTAQGHHTFPVSVRQTAPKKEKKDRLQQYLDQLRGLYRLQKDWLKEHVGVAVADGQYAKTMFFDFFAEQGVPFVTKLATNANLLIPFTGERPKRRGKPQKWERKVDFVNFEGWTAVPSERHERVWTKVVWAPHFARFLRTVVIQRVSQTGEVMGHVVLCSTDTTMSAEQIRALYSARFQLEFVFRDAKQHAGLTTCQLRNRKGLENHWHAAFLTVSLARAQQLIQRCAFTGRPTDKIVFSMEDAKRQAYNQLFAWRILTNLGLEGRFAELEKHPSRPLYLGVKAA